MLFFISENLKLLQNTCSYWCMHLQVTAVDRDSSALCGSVNDPHMTSFDGTNYNNFFEGPFILYRSQTYSTEVSTSLAHRLTCTHTQLDFIPLCHVYIYTCVWCRCLWMCALVVIMGVNHLHNNCNPSGVLSFWRFKHFTAVAMVVLHATVLGLSSLVMTLFSLTAVDQTRARMFQWMCPSLPMVTSPQELTSIVSWKENDTRCVALLCFWRDGLLPMILSKILMVFLVSWWWYWSWFFSLEIQ